MQQLILHLLKLSTIDFWINLTLQMLLVCKIGPLTSAVPDRKFHWPDGPSTDATLENEHLKEWIDLSPSRVYTGGHFMDAGIAGIALRTKVGHACSRLLVRVRAGDMTATYPFKLQETGNDHYF